MDPFHDNLITLGNTVGVAEQRTPAVLRLLGRVRYMTSQWIHSMVFPDQHRTTMQRHMQMLVDAKWVWRETIPHDILYEARVSAKSRSVPPPRQPSLYGLTVKGHEMMQHMRLEPDEQIYQLLYRRDPAKSLSRDKLAHDMMTSAWCCSVLYAARQHPQLDAVTCYVEYVTDAAQRIDALLILRFDPQRSLKQISPGWMLPWYEGDPEKAEHVTLRCALEVDRGTEPLKTLLEKSLTYRTLTESGMYTRLLGGPVLPVILVPPGRRAKQIAREWSHAWPDGHGIISTPKQAAHPQYGAIWGKYFTLCDNPSLQRHLLTWGDLESWATAVAAWTPGAPTS